MNRKHRALTVFLAVLLITAILSGCGNAPSGAIDTDDTTSPPSSVAISLPESTQVLDTEQEQTPSHGKTVQTPELPTETPAARPTTAATPSTEPSPESCDVEKTLCVPDKEAIKSELRAAIVELRQPEAMDVSAAGLSNYPVLDVKNLFSQLMSESPELKYACDFFTTLAGGILTCQISYMPYMTGNYPAGFEGASVSSIRELISMAESNIGASSAAIRITNTSLEPDSMNRALQQVGGGYVICTLNNDATQIVFSAPVGLTMDESLSSLAEAGELADKVVSEVLTVGMTEYEKATALYSYITETVKYDQRYYSDKARMPYESQTALGALKDGVAICGGYSHAVKLLFEKAGIRCYNVTGKYFRECHMWNIALLDGQWLYFDATADRGSSAQIGFYHFALSGLDTQKYTWDVEIVKSLLE